MAIDFGRRRCGIAVTDTLQLVATALATVETPRLHEFVLGYIAKEPVDAIIVGYPRRLDGSDSDSMRYITPSIGRLRKLLPEGVELKFHDERFTSTLAHRSMIDAGVSKSRRRDKGAIDRMAATIILNDYLESRKFASNV